MMSLACRAPATRFGSATLVVGRATTRRGLSTTTLPQASRPVMSRRVWQAHTKTLPKKPKVDQVKPDEKPWPRNVQIAAGVAACILVPYTTVWLISSNPTLREVFGAYLPLDPLRKHFGEVEWDSQSFDDEGDELPEGFYQYPVEDSFLKRQQQAKVEELDNGTITANIYVLGDSQIQETKQVPASVKANPRSLAELVGASTGPGSATRVAVDFVDSEVGDELDSSMSNFDIAPEENRPTRDLLKRMHTFSTWHYTPAVGAAAEQGNNKNSSDVEIDRLRLEYTVEKLEKDLVDPYCTRDHDEMRAELKEAKGDLSRLKWKSRLGF